jgi:hypothetical protein
MTYGQLKTRLAAVSHRTDLTASLPDFVEDARIKLNGRFGLTLAPFTADTDTNTVLTNFPLLYLYAALQSLYEHLNNGDNAGYYKGLFDEQCSMQNVTANSGATDPYYASPPVIMAGSIAGTTGTVGAVSDPLFISKLIVGSSNQLTTENIPLQVAGRVLSKSPSLVTYPLPLLPTIGSFFSVGINALTTGFLALVFSDTSTASSIFGLYRNKADGSLPSSGFRLGLFGFGWAQSTGDTFTSASISAYAEANIVQGTTYNTSLRFATTNGISQAERMRIKPDGVINIAAMATYADNAAAITAGLAVGDLYRTATGTLMIRY